MSAKRNVERLESAIGLLEIQVREETRDKKEYSVFRL
jgi:hypothetical protein